MFHRISITTAGWVYLILLSFIIGGALMREINLLMFVAGLMAGPLLLSAWLTSRMTSRIEVKRTVPHGIGVGETFTVQLVTTNHKKRLYSWALVLGDRISRVRPAGERPTPVSAFVPQLAPGATDRTVYEGKLFERGQYRLGPIVVASRFPLGLLRHMVRLHEMTTIYAYPRLGRLTREWTEFIQPVRAGSQQSVNRIGSMEGEFHSLRDWRSGDSRRWIHWRTSARRNELIVKQFERRQNRDLVILLDLLTSPDVTDQSEMVIEAAVRFAATIVAHHCRRGSSRMLLGIAGRELEVVCGMSSTGLMEEAMEKLAVAEGHSEPRLEELISQCSRFLKSEAGLVVLGSSPIGADEVTAAWHNAHPHGPLPRPLCIDCGSRELDMFFEDLDSVSDVRGKEIL
ncbi:MAG: DUF58 domain-containing protein [Planctomycetota bacterium]